MKSLPFFLSLLATSLSADDGVAFFEQKIRPALIEHCYECHSASAKKLKGNLHLDTKAGWQRGGDSGEPSIIAGDAEASLLIKSLRHVDDLAMPPKKKLPEAVIADFITWVKMGAPDPRTEAAAEAKRADKSWWSLQPLAAFDGSKSIDGFIEAKLSENGLAMSPEADARTLIRRATYDLTGLPPSSEEVEAFVAECARQPDNQTGRQSDSETTRSGDLKVSLSDGLMVSSSASKTEKAYSALLDRLLASRHYGENWGRHWMDVIRFGESNGFERNFNLDDVWPFRDYIIRSLNEDMPFNDFIVSHLAGDQLDAESVATAFLVCGPYDDVKNLDEKVVKEIRAVTLDDMITATSSAFLGLTINCARCHDHKFDPIPTEDYYRIRAAFEGVTHGRREIVSQAEREAFEAKTKPLREAFEALKAQREAVEAQVKAAAEVELKKRRFSKPKLSYEYNEERFPAVRARLVRFVMKSSSTNIENAIGARLDEFEVWTAGEGSRNAALQINGGKAEGKHYLEGVDADSEKTYGASLTNDGAFGNRWFIAEPPVLTVTLAKEESIDRIVFSNAREGRVEREYAQGPLPVEFELQVSTNGTDYTTILTSADHEPWSTAHGILRLRREMKQPEEVKLARLFKQTREAEAALKAVPPLRQVWAGKFEQPKDKTHVQLGGDPSRLSAQVVPASLNVLEKATKPFALPEDAPEGQRRLALAKWITSDDNPLTARVLVNRLWHYHFGTGIVDTPNDFGYLGGKPSHPELLDHLAHRLHQTGWRIKELHKEIMMSAAYRQSGSIYDLRFMTYDFNDAPQRSQIINHRSNIINPGQAVDATNRLLWRFPPRRLSAEELRDTLLAITDKLDTKLGGPPFRLFTYVADNVWTYSPIEKPGPETYRRAVYHQNIRAIDLDYLTDFDFPDIAFSAPKRASTTTPMQAFTLMNHGFTQDMAAALAAKADEVPKLYRCLLQREPTAAEIARGNAFIAQHGLQSYCRALLNLNELLYLE